MEGAKTAPVDAAESCHLAGTVYSGRILPLPAERHLRQQRDHLQRPAQIAEIMHLPPRPGLSDGAADPGVMHAVRARVPAPRAARGARLRGADRGWPMWMMRGTRWAAVGTLAALR